VEQAMKRLGYGLSAIAAAVALLAAEPRLNLAFEDRGDPRPQQFEVSAQIAGKVLALAISWTSHRSRFR
jgi:hypothetical protein